MSCVLCVGQVGKGRGSLCLHAVPVFDLSYLLSGRPVLDKGEGRWVYHSLYSKYASNRALKSSQTVPGALEWGLKREGCMHGRKKEGRVRPTISDMCPYLCLFCFPSIYTYCTKLNTIETRAPRSTRSRTPARPPRGPAEGQSTAPPTRGTTMSGSPPSTPPPLLTPATP